MKKRIIGKGLLSLLLGGIAIKSFGGELVKGQNEEISCEGTKELSKINIEKRLQDYEFIINDHEAYSAKSSTSFNAYSKGGYDYIPYGYRGKYEDMPKGEAYYQEKLSNERWLVENNDSRVKYWGDIKYDIKSVNGNDYDYVGEYKRLYSLQSKVGNVYFRDFYKTKTRAKYQTKYLHTYHGAYWWNCLLVTIRITDSYSAPTINNFKKVSTTSYQEFQGWESWEEFDRREYSEWCTSEPWRWAWEPKWSVFSTSEKYRLYFEDIQKWNAQGDNKFLKLPSLSLNKDKLNGKDVLALHLKQWYGISNVDRSRFENQIYQNADPVLDKIMYGNAGRVDYFYFNNKKVLENILDELIDAKDDLTHYLSQEYFWSAIDEAIQKYIFSKVLDLILGFFKGGLGVVISEAISGVCLVSEIANAYRIKGKETALYNCGEEMKAKLRNKENIMNNKYTILKVTQDGYWIDFADNIDNPYDDIHSVSLKYDNNYRLNGSLHESKNSIFSSIYGYPTYITDWDSVTESMKEALSEASVPYDFKLNDLVEQGTYSKLFW